MMPCAVLCFDRQDRLQINGRFVTHNYIFRQYVLSFKTCYVFRLFHEAVIRHRNKNVREDGHSKYKAFVNEQETDTSVLQIFSKQMKTPEQCGKGKY